MVCGYGLRLCVAVMCCGSGLRLWLRLQRVAAVGAAVVAVMGCGYGLRLWFAAMVCGSGCEIENEF